MSDFPIALIEDRYDGTYSGGRWLAVAEASEPADEVNTRVQFCLTSPDGPFGGDVEAGLFWDDRPEWIVAAPSPEDALKALNARPQSAQKVLRKMSP